MVFTLIELPSPQPALVVKITSRRRECHGLLTGIPNDCDALHYRQRRLRLMLTLR